MRTVIIDDHALFRDGLKRLLESQNDFVVVGEAENGSDGLNEVIRLEPEMVILDLYMPDMNGLKLAQIIKAKLPQVKIVFLSASNRIEDVWDAGELGVDGYLLKSDKPIDLLRMIRLISSGETQISPNLEGRLFKELSSEHKKENTFGLTDREEEILKLLAQGLKNKEIGKRLLVAESTVKKALIGIYTKLGADNRVEAVSIYGKLENKNQPDSLPNIQTM